MASRLSSPVEPQSVTPLQGARPGMPLYVWCAGIMLLALSLFGGHGKPSGASDFSAKPHAEAGLSPSSSAGPPTGKHLPRSEPTRLLIPKIGVDAPFTELAVDATGKLQPPPADNTNMVGWYAKGVSPGEPGAAIIAGHVDTTTSAAVFADLRELEPGDRFTVNRADGRNATFVVDSADTFAKDDFPDKRVYADTRDAEVRLITCAGDYDHSARDYTENLVVFAHLV
ncbi:class F sortase [Streptomyces sp. NPDC059837]|uniref:class F sortase n=1 Tax=unclassified Streptomyces TaxID=2593676 RepID=UPI00225BEA0F|nr:MULTISPECIES: class F sortase [unclassified Streptomyces]MCX4411009.1 class F sortase [Streptomyces sp. NBC_01764]MCX5186433.1 class F sortase [Streptomyces sp. NBC_00268]